MRDGEGREGVYKCLVRGHSHELAAFLLGTNDYPRSDPAWSLAFPQVEAGLGDHLVHPPPACCSARPRSLSGCLLRGRMTYIGPRVTNSSVL